MNQALTRSYKTILVWMPLLVAVFVLLLSPVSASADTNKVRTVWVDVSVPDYWPGDSIPGLEFPQSLGLTWYDLDVDKAGNVYLLGRKQVLEDWYLGLEECGKIHLLVKKLDRHGDQQWSYNGAGEINGGFRGHIRAGSDGKVYFSEEHYVTWSFCPAYNTGTRVVGLGPSGNTLFDYRHEIPNSWTAGPAALTVGPWGRVYASSSDPNSNRIAIFNPGDASPGFANLPFDWYYNSPLYTDGKGNLYAYGDGVAKFSSGGVLLRNIASPGGLLLGASIDRDGNSYCLWYLNNEFSFVKYDTNLTAVWSRTPPVTFAPNSTNLCVEPSGAALVWNYASAAKFGPEGNLLWSEDWTAEGWDLKQVQLDRIGNVFTIGLLATDVGTFTVIRKFDPDGRMTWQLDSCGFAACEVANTEMLRVDSRGDIYLTAKLDPWPPEETREAVIKLTQPKTLVVRDAKRDSIPNATFYLLKVHNNPPVFTEDTLGRFATNALGRIELPFAGTEGYVLPASALNSLPDTIRFGDTIKIAKTVGSKLAARHQSALGTEYSIGQDNAEFLADGSMVFDTVELGSIQSVTLRHTEYRYNLLASVEWDADLVYLQGLKEEFRQMSNYLYDVSDGQIRLDTVIILDDHTEWKDADVRIRANNNHGPDAVPGGINWSGTYPINMPRKWFGDSASSRLASYLQHPLGFSLPHNFRTIAHEFGHYALYFYDEWMFMDAGGHSLPDNARCLALKNGNYGFMDYQYDNGGTNASEMSSEYRYTSVSCHNTEQWVLKNGKSCWDDFERWAEQQLVGGYVGILRPEVSDSLERIVPAGLDYFPGPNNNLSAPNYDVGQLVQFPIAPAPPAAGIKSVHITVHGAPLGGADVRTQQKSGKNLLMEQGRTTDGGFIWALGVNSAIDEIRTGAYKHTATLKKASAAAGNQSNNRRWYFAQANLGTGSSRTATRASLSPMGDSATLTLKAVQGDYPLICEGTLNDAGWTSGLWFDRLFVQLPQLDILTEQGTGTSSIFSGGTDSYGAEVASDFTMTGSATIWDIDDSGQTFFFTTPYTVNEIGSGAQLEKVIGPGAEVVVRIDSSNQMIQRTMLLSSAYPPLMTGLNAGAVQGGMTHSLSVYPYASFTGANGLAISYDPSDLQDSVGVAVASESALRIYRWNTTSGQWQYVGGEADTIRNTVTAAITQPGVYGAFTMYGGLSCCVGRRGNINGVGIIDLVDLSSLISYLTGGGYVLPCPEAANINGVGIIDLVDLSSLISYLTGGGYLPPDCP